MQSNDARRYTMDLRRVTTKAELHDAIKTTFAFPAHYGANWDACWDCLGELPEGPLVIELVGFGVAYECLGYQMTTFLNLLHDFRRLREEKVEIRFE
ncbi:MAG: barstar family protein [Clostridia bacterium]|nr:barstar family protein [Clostridia bacterium]